MMTRVPRSLVLALATMAMVVPFFPVSGQMPARAPRYALTNVRIVTAAGLRMADDVRWRDVPVPHATSFLQPHADVLGRTIADVVGEDGDAHR